MGRLEGKVALITGGARGMGESHARHFVAEGARVVLGDVLDELGEAVAEKLGDDARYVHHDVTSEDDWANAVATTLEQFGHIDILVNNAGILLRAPIAEMSLEQFRQVIDVNLIGCWLGIKHVTAPMIAAGGGSIVNTSSIEGMVAAAGFSAYSASKFAIRGVTKAAARELGQFGIRVNSVHPGGVGTPMALAVAETITDPDQLAFMKFMPMPRLADAEEISRLVAFIASDECSFSTGSEFVADGGLLSGPAY